MNSGGFAYGCHTGCFMVGCRGDVPIPEKDRDLHWKDASQLVMEVVLLRAAARKKPSPELSALLPETRAKVTDRVRAELSLLGEVLNVSFRDASFVHGNRTQPRWWGSIRRPNGEFIYPQVNLPLDADPFSDATVRYVIEEMLTKYR